jgi:hypothetical protein
LRKTKFRKSPIVPLEHRLTVHTHGGGRNLSG